MSCIEKTSTTIHLRINQHRSDSYNYSTSYNKSTIELKHLNLHKFKNTTLKILKIHKNVISRTRMPISCFLETSYVKFYIIYLFGIGLQGPSRMSTQLRTGSKL